MLADASFSDRSRHDPPDLARHAARLVAGALGVPPRRTGRERRAVGAGPCKPPPTAAPLRRMVFKLGLEAQKHWRRLNGHQLIAKIIEGVEFVNGELTDVAA